MMGVLADAVGLGLLHFLWQGTLLGLAGALVLGVMRSAPARHRHVVAWVALLACLAWPAADLVARVTAATSETAVIKAGRTIATTPPQPRQSVAGFAADHIAHLRAAWMAGVVVLALRTIAGMAWLARSGRMPPAPAWEQRTARLALRMGIRRPVRVRLSHKLDSPVTAGWRRPLILLPARLAAAMPPAQLDALLAHELAHIRRHDYLANLVQHLITILLFFHPAVWTLSRRIAAERELLTDALAARSLDDARTLATALAELDRHRHAGLHPAQAASGGELLGRVRALLTPESTALKLRLVVPAVVLALGGAAYAAHAASDAAGQALTRRATIDFSSCARPAWPADALAAGLTGTVTLRFSIDRDGSVIDGAVERSSGHATLDQAALDGTRQCGFKPARLNGMPLATVTVLQYVWTLD